MCDSKTCWSPRSFCFHNQMLVTLPVDFLSQHRPLESFVYFLRPKPSVIPCHVSSLAWHVQNIIPARVTATEYPFAPRRGFTHCVQVAFSPRNARLVQQTQAHSQVCILYHSNHLRKYSKCFWQNTIPFVIQAPSNLYKKSKREISESVAGHLWNTSGSPHP